MSNKYLAISCQSQNLTKKKDEFLPAGQLLPEAGASPASTGNISYLPVSSLFLARGQPAFRECRYRRCDDYSVFTNNSTEI